MTPNLLRLARSCAKWRNGILLVATLAACTGAEAAVRIDVEGPVGAIAPRDTLVYTLRWGRAANATGYRLSVTAAATPAATTSGLPSTLALTDTFATFVVVNLTYDSLQFTASVTAVRGGRTNPTPSTKSWSVVKLPGPPGPITVDSSAIPLGLDLQPSEITVAQGSTTEFCAFVRFPGDVRATRQVERAGCDTMAVRLFSHAQRTVTPAQQAAADAICVEWTVTPPEGGTMTDEGCSLGLRQIPRPVRLVAQ